MMVPLSAPRSIENSPRSPRTRWRMPAMPCESLSVCALSGIPTPSSSITSDTLSELIAIDETTQFVVANMVPPRIDDVVFQSAALCANTIVFTDEPFSYMRLTTNPDELDKGVSTLLSSMDRRPGLVLACGTASAIIRGFEMPGNVTFKAYSGTAAKPEHTHDGEECFMPSVEESWCVAEVCKDCGIPDDIIYGAFV